MILLPFTMLSWVQVYTPFFVFPVQRRSFSICWKAGLVVLNCLNFCLFVKILISPLNLNESLFGQSILGCRFFSFHHFKNIMTLPLACRIPAEKSADGLGGVPVYITCYFFLIGFNIFSLSLIFISLIKMLNFLNCPNLFSCFFLCSVLQQ